MILGDVGRPEIVYGKECKEGNHEHEVLITEAEILMGMSFTRSAKVGEAIADATFQKDGMTFWVELDNETMSLQKMREKWSRYGNFDGIILVICSTKSRLRLLRKSADAVKKSILFTRLAWLQAERIRQPWIDYTCERVSI